MRLTGTLATPPRARQAVVKTGANPGTHTVYEATVLDNDGGIVTVVSWDEALPVNPDAKVGDPVDLRIIHPKEYNGITQARIAK